MNELLCYVKLFKIYLKHLNKGKPWVFFLREAFRIISCGLRMDRTGSGDMLV